MTTIPMLARPGEPTRLREYMSDPWWVQPKVDGSRLVVECDGDGGITGRNRKGDRTIVPPAVAGVLSTITLPMTFDGELVGDRPRAGSRW